MSADLARDVALQDAGDGALRDLLIDLAETHADDHRRPCCDAETTLGDWEDSGLWVAGVR